MFIRKFLENNKVDDINARGQFIKIINCESELRVRATYQGNLVFESDARAGFDVQTNKPFDLIQITSAEKQKLEVWVSQHKLSYDALSTSANRSESFVVEHFGQSQALTNYDPKQASVKITSPEKELWIGGEGVSKENGLFLAQGDVYTHGSAAPLHAFVDEKPEYRGQPRQIETRLSGQIDNDDDIIKARATCTNGDYAFVQHASALWYIVDMRTGESVRGTKRIGSNLAAYKNGFVFGGTGGTNESKLYFVSPSGDIETFTVVSDKVSVRTVAVKDGAVYILGVVTGDTRNAIRVNEDRTVQELELPRPEGVIYAPSQMDFDPYTGDLWVSYSGQGIGFYNSSLTAFTMVYNSGGLQAFGSFKFNDEHVYFPTSGTIGFVKRADKEVSFFSARGVYVSNDSKQIVAVNTRTISESRDKGVSFSELKTYDYDLNRSSLTVPIMSAEHETGVYFFVANKDRYAEALFMPFEVDKEKPRAKIRVFKESF